MSRNELIAKIEALAEWEAVIEEAKAEADALRDSIKQEMEQRGVEEMEAGTHIVRYTTIISSRLDTTAFRRQLPDVYQKYQKQVTSRRFTISA